MKSLLFCFLSTLGIVSSFLPHSSHLGWIVKPETSTTKSCTKLHPRHPLFLSSSVTEETQNGSPGRRPRRDNRRRGGYQGDEGGPGGPGVGGGPAMQLQNPLKLQRIVDTSREIDGEQSRENVDAGPPSRSSPAATAAMSSKGKVTIGTKNSDSDRGAGGSSDVGSKPFRRTPDPIGKKKDWKRKNEESDDRNNRKESLRIGTGKKGRSAEINARRGSLRRRDRSAEKAAKEEAALERKTVYLPDGPVTVSELAELLDEKPVSVIKFLMTDLGVMASMTQSLDTATCIAVTEGLGRIVGGAEDLDDDDLMDDEESALAIGFAVDEDDPDELVSRPPVVTIMGHVDHGKTSLLDKIRNTKVTEGEAGGITQHIAAYQVDHEGKKITFIDTPGHAAFTDMRERGANITDIVILVVAADDGVKQQTADSIVCARQAGVPLVVAINKCDLDTADPSRVMSDLTKYDILTEDLGGEVLCAEISAKTGMNLDDLLDKVMLQAELQDLKANPERNAQGAVVEARVERGLGTVATTLIQKGTIKIGDFFVAGSTYGRVRALIGTDGRTRLNEAGPSVPVNVVGFDGVPSAGDLLVVLDNEQDARELAENRQRLSREKESAQYQAGLMSSVAAAFGGAASKERKEMYVVVKADVQGSAEALTRALRELKLENEEAYVTVKVLISETGEVSKSDIAIASVTPGTTVLAFGVAASFDAMEDARANGVPIEYYSIIYDAIESVESRMQEVLSPTPEGEYVGSATVQEVFNIGGTGNIAGSRCTDGYIRKGANVRVMRGDKIMVETKVKSLRNFKAEADRIEEGNECGIGLIDFEAFEAGDVIECFVEM